jgi:hypothetical protein
MLERRHLCGSCSDVSFNVKECVVANASVEQKRAIVVRSECVILCLRSNNDPSEPKPGVSEKSSRVTGRAE